MGVSPASNALIERATKVSQSTLPSTLITVEMIGNFIVATGDDNIIHRDVTEARKVFGDDCPGPVAHGMLIASLIAPALIKKFGHGIVMREIGAIKPYTYVAASDMVEFELGEPTTYKKVGVELIELLVNIVRVRNGQRTNFNRDPIVIKLKRPAHDT